MNKSWIYVIALFFVMAAVSAATTTINFVSDTTTQFTYDESSGWTDAVNTYTPAAWPTLAGADWIWTSYHVSDEEAVNGSGASFRKIVELPECAKNIHANITMDADNWFFLSLGDSFVGQNFDWQYPQTFDLNLTTGNNTLNMFVMNTPLNNGNWQTNPAGLVYSGQVTYDCDDQQEVPEFGTIGAGIALIGAIAGLIIVRKRQ